VSPSRNEPASTREVAPDPILAGRRIAIVYDCLFPYTVGGGERWYQRVTEGLLAAEGEVTYLTRRQWEEPPNFPGVRVVAVSGRSELYDHRGRRRLLPTMRFGVGLLRWLIRHRGDFDTVEVASFPFWSVLAVRVALVGTKVRVVVDWFEIWSASYWHSYAGRFVGAIGFAIQRGCLALSPTIIVLSESNALRLRALGRPDPPVVLAGFFPASRREDDSKVDLTPIQPPYILYAGRHIHDKGVDLLPETFAIALRLQPGLRFVIAGDGPLRSRIRMDCGERGIEQIVDFPGFVSDEELEQLIVGATCVVVPSRREGYGFMPVDSMSKGTPVVTTGFEENLAVDNIEPGRNGFVASPPIPETIAEAIIAVLTAGIPLRQTTLDWYRNHAPTKSVDCSVRQMVLKHAEWSSKGGKPRRTWLSPVQQNRT
jgi:glycosyltransferase involved in cell wall biosynthesis